MSELDKNWLTEGIFDFEYKKYVLMAYFQHVRDQFTRNRLHPCLPELKSHLDACVSIQTNKSRIRTSLPKNLTGIDVKNWQLQYEEMHQEDAYMSDLNYLLDFAIPRFSRSIEEGTDRFSEVEENVKVSPVGIVPLHLQEGYLLFLHTFQPMVSIFYYQLALYNALKERYLKTHFIETVRIGLGNTVSQIKVDLTKRNREIPNPATYVVESKYEYPLHETLLPVAERLMLREINVA
ncbi:hypothetical protein GCM10010967_39240 [Dyadobacter beijingensis]|uniref:Uncharacterized protein n=1 Tax=Dyadobacter beijingensis TaxID=365489 RepID=A0ABQ2I6L5_9BACT|nr:hypothetical protein [Dyadobacter beijingensis]GGN01043.1 hypothetical protein GCM10010967_39240 [Dyadobacter beijingensis]